MARPTHSRATTPSLVSLLLTLSLLALLPVSAQFHGFFEQMFGNDGGSGGGGQRHQQRHQQQQQQVASDSKWYQQNYEAASCQNYLCPGTLSCVHFPHHCPCAFPELEDKVELGDGSMICASKGGFKVGEMARKVELARKGLL